MPAAGAGSILLCDKPAGITSHDMVARVRRERGCKAGHAGTLDPFATGLLIVLLGPDRSASFEFHVGEWLGLGEGSERPVLPEVKKLAGRHLLCLYGTKEDDSLCPEIAPSLGKAVALSGAHHFGGDYETVAGLILREARAGGG